MSKEEKNVFSLLVKPLQKAVEERGFSTPTEPQKKAIPLILKGKNVLLIAPPATGKTESAVLPVLNNFLLTHEKSPGIKILYITPLRALNRDLLERLQWWCNRLDVKISVRHGDTETIERSRQAKNPPDMLITTPETLQAIMPGKIMRKHLNAVRWVIIDEIHELAVDKRGSQLSLGLERLRWITMKEFQIIGLSATIGSPEKVAQFLVGSKRKCVIVKVPVARYMKLQIIYAKPSEVDLELSAKLYTHPEVAARLRIIRDLIEKHNTVLLFTNTRAVAEVLASRFKVWDIDFPLSIHHGSLAKPSRLLAEKGLKEGRLKSLVCTSSLELGIDIGAVDLVIQYNSPRQVTRLIQRVGRSGHRIGRTAKGVIITLDSDDTMEAMVIARRTLAEDLEPAFIPNKPLDALTHQIVGLLTQKKRWYFSEVLELFRQAYPYRNLSEKDIENILSYMHTRYPRLAWVSFKDHVFLKPQRTKSMYEYYFNTLSMIPDEKQFLIIDETMDTPIGVLDEAFVAEYGEPGVKFIVRGSAWKILNLYEDKIYVKPVTDPTGAIPSWVGEEIPVPHEVAMEVGQIRRFIEDKLGEGWKTEKIAAALSRSYPASSDTILEAVKETVEQFECNYPIPTDKKITIEEWKDYVIIQCCFGSLVNKTLARIIGHILSEKTDQVVGVQDDPYRIVIQTYKRISPEEIVKILQELAKTNIQKLAVEAVVKTGIFKRRIVHVARKFGAISKWADFSSINLKQLLKSFEGTVIFEEAVKDTLNMDMDVQNTVEVLKKIKDGSIDVVTVKNVEEATPISRIGIERISRKTDLIPPEKMRSILIESTRARLLNEAGVFVCTNCWNFVKMTRIKELAEKVQCPKCQSTLVGMVKMPEEDVLKICEKKGKDLKGKEEKISELARATADLISKHGFVAALALAGHNLRPVDVEEILMSENEVSDNFFEKIIEAERRALKRKFF